MLPGTWATRYIQLWLSTLSQWNVMSTRTSNKYCLGHQLSPTQFQLSEKWLPHIMYQFLFCYSHWIYPIFEQLNMCPHQVHLSHTQLNLATWIYSWKEWPFRLISSTFISRQGSTKIDIVLTRCINVLGLNYWDKFFWINAKNTGQSQSSVVVCDCNVRPG